MAVTIFFCCIASERITPASKPTLKQKSILLSTGIQLEYAEQGDENGIPVILLHGYTDSWHSYEMVLPHLSNDIHVYAVSLRGHGNSSKPASSYLPVDFANDLADFIQQLKIGPVVIVGHSMGSTIAQCFAINYPGLVKGLVLAGAFADYNKPAVTEFQNLVSQLKEPVDSAFIAGFQNGTCAKPVAKEVIEKSIIESMRVPLFVWKSVAAGWKQSNFVNKLRNFNKPVLIIWGDRDFICSYQDQELLLHTLKHSKLLIYKTAGHALHWEEPQKFATDLTSFIHENFWGPYIDDEGLWGIKPMSY